MFLRQTFQDAGDQTAETEGWRQHYRQLGAGHYESVNSLITLPGVMISRETINVAVMQGTLTPAGSSIFLFPITAEGGWRINGHHEQESVVALRQGSTELMTTVGTGSDLIALSFHPDTLPPPARCPGTFSFRRTAEDGMLIDWVHSLIELCADGFQLSAADGQLLSELLAERFIDFAARLDSARLVDLQAGTARYDLFRRVQLRVDQLPDEPVTLTALTRHLGVPMTEIHASILQCTGLRPAAWLGCYRLDGARRDLLTARKRGRRISDIAMSWGFHHLGRFSCFYHRHFGETPRATIRRGLARH